MLEPNTSGFSEAPSYVWLAKGQSRTYTPQMPYQLIRLVFCQAGQLLQNGIGALTFGVELQNNLTAYPRAPTWMLYAGRDDFCLENVPVVISRDNFCRAFVADARIFPVYSSWLLSLLLTRVTLILLTASFTLYSVNTAHTLDKHQVNPHRQYNV